MAVKVEDSPQRSRSHMVQSRHWFEEWREPNEFFDAAHRINDPELGVPTSHFLGKNQYKYIREAWVAGNFAAILATKNTIRVKLGADSDGVDFHILANGEDMPFQQTEALRPGRKRTLEYQKVENGEAPATSEFSPDAELAAIPESLRRAIKGKADRRPTPKPHLLVYVNLETFGDMLPTGQLVLLTRPWKDSFQSIFLLWANKVVRCWPLRTRESVSSWTAHEAHARKQVE